MGGSDRRRTEPSASDPDDEFRDAGRDGADGARPWRRRRANRAAWAGGIVAGRHLAGSPSPVNSRKADSLPRVEVVRPRRVTVAQRLQTNATLEAFEEADLFAKVSGYLSDVRVDIGDHVKAGQVLAVIDVPEMEKELAEAKAQLESKRSSLESARRQLDHRKADI